MKLPGKILEQIAFNTRPMPDEHILVVMYKSTHEEHMSEPLQTKIKQFEITGSNGFLIIKNKNKNTYFTVSINVIILFK